MRLTAANYTKLAQADPARAIAELTAEESPHPLVRYLPPETREPLVARAQLNARAGQLDAERNATLAAQESQRAPQGRKTATSSSHSRARPISPLRIASDPALTPDGRRRLLDTAQRTTQPDPPATTSTANALQMLDRIRRDDGDPERLVDPDEILDTYNKGDLSQEHYNFVQSQFDEARTPEGARLAAQKRSFMQTFKPVVDPTRPDADAVAAEQRFQIEQALAARVTRMRDNNQDPGALFDPSTPDYIRAHFELVPQLIPRGTPAEPSTQLPPSTLPPATDSAQPAEPNPNPKSYPRGHADPTARAVRCSAPGSNPADTRGPVRTGGGPIRNSVIGRHEGSGTEVFNRIMSSYGNAEPPG